MFREGRSLLFSEGHVQEIIDGIIKFQQLFLCSLSFHGTNHRQLRTTCLHTNRLRKALAQKLADQLHAKLIDFLLIRLPQKRIISVRRFSRGSPESDIQRMFPPAR